MNNHVKHSSIPAWKVDRTLSGRDGQLFVKIFWPLENHLCVRVCVFECAEQKIKKIYTRRKELEETILRNQAKVQQKGSTEVTRRFRNSNS